MRSFVDLADAVAPEAGVLSLNGDVRDGPMRRFFKRRAEGVYDMEDLETRAKRLDAFLRAAFETYGIDPVAAVGLGYSNGANILAHLALRGSDVLPRRVLMHPLIPHRPEPAPDLSALDALITAGRRDPIGPEPATAAFARDLAAYGATVRTAWHDGGHEVRPEELTAVQAFLAGDAEVRA
ncbi:MAG: alpha/beta hydrolase, partial [Pseudomonadota bacterium]